MQPPGILDLVDGIGWGHPVLGAGDAILPMQLHGCRISVDGAEDHGDIMPKPSMAIIKR